MEGKELEREILESTQGFSNPPTMFQVKAYLVTQPEPLVAFQKLCKTLNLDVKLVRAVNIEMRRIGFGEFQV